MTMVDCREDAGWLPLVLDALRYEGAAVVTGVLDEAFLQATRAALYAVRDSIEAEIGTERLRAAGELGVLRLMPRYHGHFYRFLQLPELLAVVDATVSSTAILHLQNGFILPPFPPGDQPRVSQNRFHMDFPRVLNGHLMSMNVLFAIDAFTASNGGTLIVPGSHQKADRPAEEYMRRVAVPAECPAGSMLVFDSTLWHAAGANASGADRLAVNHQFTRSYLKQQIDYVRALGEESILAQPARTQQLLGWYTRVVTGLDEYYRPERLYRSGQG